MARYDFLIVGAGFAGAILAERLASINKKVILVERRDHIGGNSYDFYDDYGILVHKYGPHYFRTDNQYIFDYLSRFTKWRQYEYRVRTFVNGKLFPFPINLDTINMFFKTDFKNQEEIKNFLESKRVKIEKPKNAEEQVVSKIGWELYNNFFKNYTIKQWKTDPKNLDPLVTARIPIRYDKNDKYFDASIQAMPRDGYFKLFENMLEGIEILYNTEFKEIKDDLEFDNLIYTGPIDEFFDYKYGKLPYRSLNFKFEHYRKKFYQDWVQINYPNDYEYTRIVEIKHATGQDCNDTTIVKEYPSDNGPPFYPIPSVKNYALYEKYLNESKNFKNFYFIGRLATYRYLNMDQVVKEALNLFNHLRRH